MRVHIKLLLFLVAILAAFLRTSNAEDFLVKYGSETATMVRGVDPNSVPAKKWMIKLYPRGAPVGNGDIGDGNWGAIVGDSLGEVKSKLSEEQQLEDNFMAMMHHEEHPWSTYYNPGPPIALCKLLEIQIPVSAENRINEAKKRFDAIKWSLNFIYQKIQRLPGGVEFKVGNVLSEYGSNFLDVEKKIRSLEDRVLNDSNLWGLDSELTEIASLESSAERLQQSVQSLLDDLTAQSSPSPSAPPKRQAEQLARPTATVILSAVPVALPYSFRFTDSYWGTCEATITESKIWAHEVTPEGGDLSDVCDIAANRSKLELASSLVNQDHHWMIRTSSKDGSYVATHSSKRFGSGSEASIAIPVQNEVQARLVHAIVAHVISGTPLPTINGANSQGPSSARSPEAPNQPTEQIGEAEAGLNSTYSAIRNSLTPQQKESLKKDELQWIKWKDSLSPQEKLAAVQKRIAMLQQKYGTGAPQNTRNSEDTETQLAKAESNLNLVYRRIWNRLNAEQKQVLKQREVEWISMKDSLPAAQRVSEIHKRIQILEQEYGEPQ
jgi:uncharacterized protein YecT (DUF1311 family)